MATMFGGGGTYVIDYLAESETISGTYYAALLDKVKFVIVEERIGIGLKTLLFHQENAPFRVVFVFQSFLVGGKMKTDNYKKRTKT